MISDFFLVLEDTGAYCEFSNKWVESASLQSSRFNFGITVYDGGIFVAGGKSKHRNQLKSIERFSGRRWMRWSVCLDVQRNRFGICTNGDVLYAVGGDKKDTISSRRINTKWWEGLVEISNEPGVVHDWTTHENAKFSSRVGMSVTVADGKMYVIGGISKDGAEYLNVVEEYDIATASLKPISSMNSLRCAPGVVFMSK